MVGPPCQRKSSATGVGIELYKDSTHRLFLAEVEKLKEQDKAKKAFSAIRQRIDSIIDHELIAPMLLVDEGGEKTGVRQ